MSPHRVVNVSHLQQVLGAAVLLHLDGLPAPLRGYAVIFGEVRVWGHLKVSTFKDDLVDVVLVFPLRSKHFFMMVKTSIHQTIDGEETVLLVLWMNRYFESLNIQ